MPRNEDAADDDGGNEQSHDGPILEDMCLVKNTQGMEGIKWLNLVAQAMKMMGKGKSEEGPDFLMD